MPITIEHIRSFLKDLPHGLGSRRWRVAYLGLLLLSSVVVACAPSSSAAEQPTPKPTSAPTPETRTGPTPTAMVATSEGTTGVSNPSIPNPRINGIDFRASPSPSPSPDLRAFRSKIPIHDFPLYPDYEIPGQK